MKDRPLVTIAIPTYNRAASYLRSALESALGQTYPALEILVSDNASTDGTPELVASFGDPRLRYFRHRESLAPNDNFNFCFQQARGAYVLLLHDDDLIDADLVGSCMEAAANAPDAAVIRTGTRLIDFEGRVIREIPNAAAGLSTDAFFRAWFAGRTAVYVCSTVFHAQKLKEIGGFRSKYYCYQDTMAIFRLAARYGRIDLADVKASFRIHRGEMGFGRRIDDWCGDSLALLDLLCELAPDNREEVAREGRRFFFRANYHRAMSLDSPLRRLASLMRVLRYFGYREMPPPELPLHVLHGTRLYRALRSVKRRLLYLHAPA